MKTNEYDNVDITLNGQPADFYANGDNQVLIIPKDLGNYTKDRIENPDMLLVTNQYFKQTIHNRNGKF
jgi:hypothetical protein